MDRKRLEEDLDWLEDLAEQPDVRLKPQDIQLIRKRLPFEVKRRPKDERRINKAFVYIGVLYVLVLAQAWL